MATPTSNQQALRDAFEPLSDLHERLSLIISACAGSGLPEDDRLEGDLVPGCASQVWLRRTGPAEVLHLEWDAGSPLVRGLAGLICQVYQDTAPADALAFRSRILPDLGLDRLLSPTRLRGLAAMEVRIQQLAST